MVDQAVALLEDRLKEVLVDAVEPLGAVGHRLVLVFRARRTVHRVLLHRQVQVEVDTRHELEFLYVFAQTQSFNVAVAILGNLILQAAVLSPNALFEGVSDVGV